ncbi:hypothetical protein BFP97_06090 [Roseivirga sp. 4D4]|uniref:CPBP family intramembrane glutamic endopeptidase n=1 Tax=Roseivirga sp. 4D4 TaxID=1889784 RepID=UPI000852F572|nr:CPBP family intramembrane glutamic endopeptidase [Roseivirga sp. 4D4]OEK01103.1 hypothetical protein BFP97_06090 [Roseivirga sp. 4D4]
MNNIQKRIFQLSLVIIVAYWLYDVFKLTQPPVEIPSDTTALLTRIAFLKIAVFSVITILVFGQGHNLSFLGWKSQKCSKQLLIGTLFGIITFALTRMLIDPMLNSIFPRDDQGPGIMAHFTNMSNLWIWLLFGIIGGGFVEELQRVFIFSTFEKWKGKGIIAWVVLIDIISFGIGHLYQGLSGAISAAISGLIFALIYLRKRSFLEAFTAHAIYDVIGITLGHIIMQQMSQAQTGQ